MSYQQSWQQGEASESTPLRADERVCEEDASSVSSSLASRLPRSTWMRGLSIIAVASCLAFILLSLTATPMTDLRAHGSTAFAAGNMTELSNLSQKPKSSEKIVSTKHQHNTTVDPKQSDKPATESRVDPHDHRRRGHKGDAAAVAAALLETPPAAEIIDATQSHSSSHSHRAAKNAHKQDKKSAASHKKHMADVDEPSDHQKKSNSHSKSKLHSKSPKPHSSADASSDSQPEDQQQQQGGEPSKNDTETPEGNEPSSEGTSIINSSKDCAGPYPGYPYCQDKVDELRRTWMVNPGQEAYYRSKGVDGTTCSFLTYLNLNGFYCPEAADVAKSKIRGVNLGGWLVLEPWIKPSLFEQFDPKHGIQDQWMFCEHLGPKECRRQLEHHWDTWLLESDLAFLAESGINHVRIPFGYWIFGDIRRDEPWVDGELPYLERAIRWAAKYNIHVILDLHCAPGSQNGFDNSGRKGEVHFGDAVKARYGRMEYPNIRRALEVIANVTQHFSQAEFRGTVVGIELVNEAFVTIPIQVVKDYYLQGYEIVKAHGDTMAVIIGDSFRFGAWNDFMFPPHYRHVWIDTHIYQVFDSARLGMTWSQHLTQTCKLNKPEVAVAPLSTMVGEWSLATTDCAKWLNGYGIGARFDGTMPGGQIPVGSCIGQDDLKNTTIWTPEYRAFLLEFASRQMDAYESGSSEGWFFWNFKTEKGAFQWNYMLGVQEGWIPKDPGNRPFKCDDEYDMPW